MKLKHNQLAASGLSVLILTGLVACGQVEDATKDYTATLTEVNPLVAPGVTGNATIILNKDNLTINVDVAGAPAGVHMQGISVGGACPTMANDTNGDGYIDGPEAQAVTGKTLIPLDSDLASQSAGAGQYPSDNYNYSQSTSFAQMVGDLLLPDATPNDSIVKLSPSDELTFQGKVVVVYGVPADTALPATVVGTDRMTQQASLPIACGVIIKEGGSSTTGGSTGTATGSATGGSTGTATTGGTTTSTTTGGTATGGTATGTTTGGSTGTATTGTTAGGTTTGDTTTGTTTGGSTGTTTTTGGTTGVI